MTNTARSIGNTNYDDYSCYDVADMVKLYYRELPEPILTSQLSETLIIIQQSMQLILLPVAMSNNIQL